MAVSYDVVCEILVRVKDVKTLFRCATVCKGWRGLFLADGCFLHRCLPRDNSIVGFFTQHTHHVGGVQTPCFIPAANPVFGTRYPFISPFFPVPTYRRFCTADMEPLASRQHLLLLRLGGQLAVCNTLAGTLHMLPSIDYYCGSDGYMTGYALLTAAENCWSLEDEDRTPSAYKVIIIAIEKDTMQYGLHMLSSASGESSTWETSSGSLSLSEHHSICATIKQSNAVVRYGLAHWLFCGTSGLYTIDVSSKTGHVSITALPNVGVLEFYGEPYLSVDDEERLTVLSLKQDGTMLHMKTWDHDRTFTGFGMAVLGTPFRQTKEIEGIVYTSLGEKNGMLLVKDNHDRIYIVDVKTSCLLREVTELSCTRGLSHQHVVPLEMNWPAFFVSRLGEVRS